MGQALLVHATVTRLRGVLVLCAPACRTPDPKALLDVTDVDAFWAVEPSMGGEQYITPAVKLRIHNRRDKEQHSVQAMAVFRRKGEENLTWGSAFEQVVSRMPGSSWISLESSAAAMFGWLPTLTMRRQQPCIAGLARSARP